MRPLFLTAATARQRDRPRRRGDARRSASRGAAGCGRAISGGDDRRLYRPRGRGRRHTLPPEHLAAFDCRNNRLADLALGTDGFAEAVARGADRYGAGAHRRCSRHEHVGRAVERGRLPRARSGDRRAAGPFDYSHTHDMFSLARFVRAALGAARPGDGRLHGVRVERPELRRCARI